MLWNDSEKPDRNPTSWVKLVYFQNKDGSVSKTPFIGLDGTELKWEDISKRGIVMKGKPLLSIDSVYFGPDKISIQVRVKSVIVYGIEQYSAAKIQIESLSTISEEEKEEYLKSRKKVSEGVIDTPQLSAASPASVSTPTSVSDILS